MCWVILDFIRYRNKAVRGFWRRAGGSYSFVHRTLMEHFVETEMQRIEAPVQGSEQLHAE